jgi:hypothetical protein
MFSITTKAVVWHTGAEKSVPSTPALSVTETASFPEALIPRPMHTESVVIHTPPVPEVALHMNNVRPEWR